MKKYYTLSFRVEDYIQVTVEADDLEEAIEKGEESKTIMDLPLSEEGNVNYLDCLDVDETDDDVDDIERYEGR